MIHDIKARILKKKFGVKCAFARLKPFRFEEAVKELLTVGLVMFGLLAIPGPASAGSGGSRDCVPWRLQHMPQGGGEGQENPTSFFFVLQRPSQFAWLWSLGKGGGVICIVY